MSKASDTITRVVEAYERTGCLPDVLAALDLNIDDLIAAADSIARDLRWTEQEAAGLKRAHEHANKELRDVRQGEVALRVTLRAVKSDIDRARALAGVAASEALAAQAELRRERDQARREFLGTCGDEARSVARTRGWDYLYAEDLAENNGRLL